MSLPTKKYRPLIRAAVDLVGFPAWDGIPAPVWVEGQVMTESGGNPKAMRYEPHLDSAPDGDQPAIDDGVREDDRSYGLLQVLGSNIRARWGIAKGTPMDFSAALLPQMGLALGLSHLAGNLQETGGNVARALAKYNYGGNGGTIGPDGKMVGKEYVDKVREAALRVLSDTGSE